MGQRATNTWVLHASSANLLINCTHCLACVAGLACKSLPQQREQSLQFRARLAYREADFASRSHMPRQRYIPRRMHYDKPGLAVPRASRKILSWGLSHIIHLSALVHQHV